VALASARAETFLNVNKVPLIVALGAIFYFTVLWLHSWATSTTGASSGAESRRQAVEQVARHLWPSTTLARLLAIGLPIAAAITVGVLRSGGGSGFPAVTSAGQSAPPAASQADKATDRNRVRLSDLLALRDALDELAKRGLPYPSTEGKVQTLCTYEAQDVGCVLKQILAEIPFDPLGKNFGYFYLSDGSSFTVAARWEGSSSPPPQFRCPQPALSDSKDARLACLDRSL